MKKAKKKTTRITKKADEARGEELDACWGRVEKAEEDLMRERERRMRLEEEARATRQVLITEGSPFAGSLVELAHYIMGTYAPVQQRALKVLQLGNDLRDAGRRIVELEGQVKCRIYEDWLLTQELDRAGAPVAKTPVERLQALLRASQQPPPAPSKLFRARVSGTPPPGMAVPAVASEARHRVDLHCWLECSTDNGHTWQVCNARGEQLP